MRAPPRVAAPRASLTRPCAPAVDGYEFSTLPEHLTRLLMVGVDGNAADNQGTVEYKPPFHEWASALPGMVALSRKSRAATFRNYVAAETAAPVIVCAACIPINKEDSFFFAGIVRSKSVRQADDGVGPQVDEFFTVSIGGMATIMNTCTDAIFPGDMIEWTFVSDIANPRDAAQSLNMYKRSKTASPRRVGIKVADPLSDKIIGRALSFAKSGESLDILIKSC